MGTHKRQGQGKRRGQGEQRGRSGRRFYGKVGATETSESSLARAWGTGNTKPRSDPVQDEWGDVRPSTEKDRIFLEEQRPPHWG